MPNSKENIKHSFSDTYRAVENPPEREQVVAGYLEITSREALQEAKRRRRALKLNRRRQRKWRARQRRAGKFEGIGVHPTVTQMELKAVEEAASLA